MKHFVLFLTLVFASAEVFAAGVVQSVNVTQVRADKDGFGYISFSEDLAGSPASCSSDSHKAILSFDLNSPGGQGIMSIGLSALASGKKVHAVGTGSCDQYGSVESWLYGWIKD
ncbi:hypothetical protein ACL7TT_17075 [Microbulbifer sp. 2304DJ12-6]|uniref:hypothetical protein n=1 Tax=Microbulbifer sp. 2304DJ12-6 TaxID=3233340 RepID=UPI0039B11423